MSKFFGQVPIPQGLEFLGNIIALRDALEKKLHLYGQRELRRQPGSPHVAMRDIWIRWNDFANLGGNSDAERMKFCEEHDSVWYPEALELPEVRAVLFQLMAAVQGERLGGVLITNLPPGARIEKHRDAGWHPSYYTKFFVPIQCDPGATFHWEDGSIEAAPGEAWWFHNAVNHWVTNDSERSRIVLIACIKTDLYQAMP